MPHTLSRILEVTNNSLKIEINDKGTITGRYMGTQLVPQITQQIKTVLQAGVVNSCKRPIREK